MTNSPRVINCDPVRISQKVNASLARQGFASKYSFQLTAAKMGFVEITVPFDEVVSDGQGRFHSGIVGALADVVGSYAGFTLLPQSDSGLSFEYKLNVLEPAIGEKIVGRGMLVKEGSQTMFSKADIFAVRGDTETLCATGSVSIVILHNTPDQPK